MNREEFVKMMIDDKTERLSRDERLHIIEKSLDRCAPVTKSLIFMEELSELSQEVSKAMRRRLDGKMDDNVGLIEEMADVIITLNSLSIMYDIPVEAVDKAIDIKLIREKYRCKEDL